jgi:hypothetical protein
MCVELGDHPMKNEPSSYLKQWLFCKLSQEESLLGLPSYIHSKQHLLNHEFGSLDFGFKNCSEQSTGKNWETVFYFSISKLPKTFQDLPICVQSASRSASCLSRLMHAMFIINVPASKPMRSSAALKVVGGVGRAIAQAIHLLKTRNIGSSLI